MIACYNFPFLPLYAPTCILFPLIHTSPFSLTYPLLGLWSPTRQKAVEDCAGRLCVRGPLNEAAHPVVQRGTCLQEAS